MSPTLSHTIEQLHRAHYRELIAPLIRTLGSFELAEDVVQDAFAKALESWRASGVPPQPLAWLKRVAKNRAIDQLRRQTSWISEKAKALAEITMAPVLPNAEAPFIKDPPHDSELESDELRLIFTCCHPSLAPQAQIALTLKTICGLNTEQVARMFLIKPTTLQQRIVRAKRKIDRAKIPYVIPCQDVLPERLATVLRTIYLVFNEGYRTSEGEALICNERCEEGIRLGRLLCRLMPQASESKALLALMLLHHSRRNSRTDEFGELVTLDEQDRSLWDQNLIAEALPLVELALGGKPVSTYAIEAAIAALHARAQRASETDWSQIAALYELLRRRSANNPVIALNHAVAIAMAGHIDLGLSQLNRLESEGLLRNYHLLHAARADLLRRLVRLDEAKAAYLQARELATNPVERRFIERRLGELVSLSKKV